MKHENDPLQKRSFSTSRTPPPSPPRPPWLRSRQAKQALYANLHPPEDQVYPQVEEKGGIGQLRKKYVRLVKVALTVQNMLEDFANTLERMHAFINWADPRATLIFVFICLGGCLAICAFSLPVVMSLGLCWTVFLPPPPPWRSASAIFAICAILLWKPYHFRLSICLEGCLATCKFSSARRVPPTYPQPLDADAAASAGGGVILGVTRGAVMMMPALFQWVLLGDPMPRIGGRPRSRYAYPTQM